VGSLRLSPFVARRVSPLGKKKEPNASPPVLQDLCNTKLSHDKNKHIPWVP
jgi:hypothetical protein